ncbi:MAG: PAS domain S-box protein [Gammaproteobacteria bacterium]|nr:PAS domain S-box protein [Gammaproteobacteria bacterium]
MLNLRSARSPIAYRLIIYIILFSSAITLLTTAAQLYRDYSSDLEHIHGELQQIEGVHLESLASALWTSNRQLLQTSIEGILQIRDMQYVEIRDTEQVWARAGIETDNSSRNNSIERIYPINYRHRGKDINIGRLSIVVTLDGVYQRLISRVWVILISNGLKTFLVAIFIYFLFHHLVTRHLSRISAFAEEHNPLSDHPPLTLDRDTQNYDEFDTVVKSINDMQRRLQQQVTEIGQQKQYLLQTLNSIGDAVIATDAEGNITRLNPVAEQLTGWSLKEARGLSVKDIFPIINASTRRTIENPVEKVISSGETVYLSNHTTLISRNGREYQIADSAAPIRDEENNILGMVLVFNDVTEAYRLRQAAATSKKQYETLTTVAPVGIFYANRQGDCLFINKKWSEITGIAIGKAQGDNWKNGLHPQDRERVLAEWRQLIEQNKPFKCEYRFQHANNIRWVLGEALAEEGENNEVVGFVGSITDITDRKKAEEAVLVSEQAMAEAQRMAHIGSWKLDPVTNKLLWSDEVYSIFEIDPKQFEASYEVFINAVHPDDREKVHFAYTESLKNKTFYNINHRLRMSDGSIKYVIERGKTIYDDNDKPLCSTGTVQDITEQVILEETLQRSQKMDALGKLTGGIAHDYNNMLGVIMGYASILEEQLGAQPKLRKYAQQIHYAGERGAKLTRKLLSFSRHKSSDTEKLNLNVLLKEEQDMLQKTLTARIQLSFELSDNLWSTYLDRGDLEDTIVNLCINAAHAMEDKGLLTILTANIQINELDARLLQIDTGDYVLLSITDTGCGMNSIEKEKIFEPFYSTKGDKGTGLGLSQVYGFVTRSHGAIKVYSELDQGTQFKLYFPRCERNNQYNTSQKENNPASIQGNETILIVDDEPALLALSSEILSQQGYQILCANNGQQAIDILENESIDLLLSDVIMPEMDGYELAAIVEEKYPEIKILLASGFNDERHRNMVNENLSNNLLHKPYNSQTLLKKIRNLLT